MKKILCCSCFNMNKKASETFSLLFPNEILPDIIRGRGNIGRFAQEVNNKHITAISKLNGKFAYYVELEGGKIVKEYDLLKGARIA